MVPERDRSVLVRQNAFGRRVSLWAPLAIYAAAIFGFSSIPYPPAPPAAITDKHLHAALYAGFALVVLRALAGGYSSRQGFSPTKWRRSLSPADRRGLTIPLCLSAIAIVVAYGVSDEWHQRFVPGRSADVLDLLADAAGAVIAVTLAWLASHGARRASIGRTATCIREVGETS